MSQELLNCLEVVKTNLKIYQDRLAENGEKRKDSEAAAKLAHDNIQQLLGAIHASTQTKECLESAIAASRPLEDPEVVNGQVT